MTIFAHLKISLLKVLSIGGRKSVHAPPPCTPLFCSVFHSESVLSGLKLPAVWASFPRSHEVCMPPPHAHTTFSLLFDQITPFSSSRDPQERKIACARTWFWVKNTTEQGCAWGGGHAHLKEHSTTSRWPHQACLQIDLQIGLQIDFQIDYVCNLTT